MKTSPVKLGLRITLVVLVILVTTLRGIAVNNHTFKSLTTVDGLSNNTVLGINQDNLGNIWIATADGLNKFDGESFTNYFYSKENLNTVGSNHINTIFSADSLLLIGSSEGLSIFDIIKDKFINYTTDFGIIALHQISEDSFYILSEKSIYRYGVENNEFVLEYTNDKFSFQTVLQYKGKILIGTKRGLYTYNSQTKSLSLFTQELENTNIQALLPDGDDLWVATEGYGLCKLVDSKIHLHYLHLPNNENKSLSSSFVRSLTKDCEGNLWIGTFEGLDILHEDGSITKIESNKHTASSINQNSVRSLFCDNQGGVWIGTYFGGLNYYHPLLKKFDYLQHESNANSISDDIISYLKQDPYDSAILWIGTNDGGLNKYNQISKKVTIYKANRADTNQLQSNNIKSILPTAQVCYIGSHGGGFSILNKRTSQSINFSTRNSSLPSNDVYALEEDKDVIWLGTLSGLVFYKPNTKEFKSISDLKPWSDLKDLDILKRAKIFALKIDSRRRLWIGSDLGVFSYSIDKNLLTKYDLPSKMSKYRINCFYEDSNFRISVGTSFGLLFLDEGTQGFKLLNSENGLPNDNVCAVLQDKQNRFWVSTNKGLVSYNSISKQLKVYTHNDGLLNDQFTPNAFATNQSGDVMYFGSFDGIVYFNPNTIIDNPFSPAPVISNLSINSTKVRVNDDTDILKEDIAYATKLTLLPTQNSFSMDFSVPNYISMKHNKYAYRLKNVDADWIYLNSNTLTYANLKAGTYQLEVKASNGEGVWSSQSRELVIEVLPFWWQTKLFNVLLVLLIVGLIYLALRVSHTRQVFKNKIEIERLEMLQSEEINQMKLRFFINISHEFRTPLTLILSPIDELIENNTDPDKLQQLQVIKKNANRLLYLVNQLLDHRQAELGVFTLKATYNDCNEKVSEIVDLFVKYADKKNIKLKFNSEISTNKLLLFDASYLDLILTNLLSNAFKFTSEGNVTVTISVENNKFIIKVLDSGCGVSEVEIDKIFERFYQSNYHIKGTGIGLSIVHKLVVNHHGDIKVNSDGKTGTEFVISIPQDESLYTTEEILTSCPLQIDGDVNERITANIDISDFDELADLEIPAYSEDKPSMLIVEDDIDVRNYLIRSFSQELNIFTSDNGVEPIQILRNQPIDIVITDVMLPIQDGYKLCRAIKKNIKTNHIPVIMLTAKTSSEDQMEGLLCGADDYITKPFKMSYLKIKVRNRLQQNARIIDFHSDTLEVNPEDIAFNESDKEFLEKAKSIIEHNLDNINFKVDDFCESMAMSRSNLHLKMKAITGESTIEFIKKIRFNEACKLLRDGRYSINEISSMVGFNTPSYFTTSFKKHFGVLPTAYLKSLKDKR